MEFKNKVKKKKKEKEISSCSTFTVMFGFGNLSSGAQTLYIQTVEKTGHVIMMRNDKKCQISIRNLTET